MTLANLAARSDSEVYAALRADRIRWIRRPYRELDLFREYLECRIETLQGEIDRRQGYAPEGGSR